ncbi:hypothetical protein BEL04_15565 [Mucilaginibacter sp. PPCGB 2223]|uniref:DKNYY domain-containing protein n=1 Tax=Mucilaginibacter sp. PPCGB 2223 TaxID=1886027 RepID=UPI00082446AF|nr:DKNYY domain-containing protein [Mucilaginibacter sp. PPCGB 2223]OCX51443.1 hypothetical protein BEL04_15565 [Mucilaginibacter sp. PPCGB 2223]
MKRSTITIIGVLLIVVGLCFKSCQDGYEIDNGKVYYNYNVWLRDSDEGRINYIDSADAATFKELGHSNYAVDKNSVYYKQYRIYGADPLSFYIINPDSATDKYATYGFEKRFVRSR